MKNLNENRGLFIFAYGISTAIMGMVIYPLFDFLLCKFITNSTFKYTVADHVIEPITFGFIFALVYSFVVIKKK